MKFARHIDKEEIIVAVAEHKQVEFLYTQDEYDYFTIDGKWVCVPSNDKCIHGVQY